MTFVITFGVDVGRIRITVAITFGIDVDVVGDLLGTLLDPFGCQF